MNLRPGISCVWGMAAILLMTGCSHFDTLVRSTKNPTDRSPTVADATILDEATVAYQAGNLIQAEERYKEYLERNSRSGDQATLAFAKAQLGRIALEKNDFKASRQYFDEATRLDPENLQIRGMYAESLYRQKDYKQAEILFKQALQEAPENERSKFQIMLGRTLAEQKQYQAGQRYLKQALGDQKAYEEMAFIYRQHGEGDMAVLAMGKARDSQMKNRQLAALTESAGQGAGDRNDASQVSGNPVHELPPLENGGTGKGNTVLAMQQQYVAIPDGMQQVAYPPQQENHPPSYVAVAPERQPPPREITYDRNVATAQVSIPSVATRPQATSSQNPVFYGYPPR